jgi:phosphoglycerate kinase
MKLRTIRDADLRDKRVLVRLDLNVPLNDDGSVGDPTRIEAALPTLCYLLEQGSLLVLCSHLGRPKGFEDNLRLTGVAAKLDEVLNAELARLNCPRVNVRKLDDCVGPEVEAVVQAAGAHDVILLENLRFHPEEEANDAGFARQLAALGDVYVNDAFGAAHRAHASTEGVAHVLPAYAGFLIEKEVTALSRVLDNPRRPLTVVMGGAKISDKIEVIEKLLPLSDTLLIGGAMANTFLRAQGFETGSSRVEEDQLDTARRVLEQAERQGVMLLTPVDFVVTDDIKAPQRVDVRLHHSIAAGDIAADIGPKTARTYGQAIAESATVFWNGPMGVFETAQFAEGTLAVARALAEAEEHAYTVVGGGESVEAVNQAGVAARIGHISTGGGASLEFLGGRELPGLKVLAEE